MGKPSAEEAMSPRPLYEGSSFRDKSLSDYASRYWPLTMQLARPAIALVIFWSVSYLSFVVSAIAGYRTPRVQFLDQDGHVTDATGLPDLGHEFVKFVLSLFGSDLDRIPFPHAPDLFVKYICSISIMFMFFHPDRLNILKRLPIILSIVILFRIVCILSTSLPDPNLKCINQFTDPDSIYKWESMFPHVLYRGLVVFASPDSHVSCGDMIFSGHASCLVMAMMTFKYYCKSAYFTPVKKHDDDDDVVDDHGHNDDDDGKDKVAVRYFNPFAFIMNRILVHEYVCKAIRRIVYLSCSIGILLIIATKFHYTVDVILAIFITRIVFVAYHDWLEFKLIGKRIGAIIASRWIENELV